ncbi:HDOD domain-containing protein [Candidatus Poribacteria bacterium]|nr:HDOD domain-containing protein [Candidatus Poribacteria bacterium]
MESAFISGLLHDMGKVILAEKAAASREQTALPYSTSETTRLKLEEMAFGVTHAEAGYLLAEHWLLPPIVGDAIRFHHSPQLEIPPKAPTSIVFLANTFCQMAPKQLKEDVVLEGKALDVFNTLEMSEVAFRTSLKTYASMASEIPAI